MTAGQRLLRDLCGTGNLIVLIGPAGSGKSTLAADQWEPGEIISLDELRGRVSGDPCDQAATGAAAQVMHAITSGRLDRRLTTVIDATNTQARVREGLLDTAARYGVDAVAVVLDTPLGECLARNSTRPGPLPGRKFGRRVPDHVIERQHAEMLAGLHGLRREGFTDDITWKGQQ